MGVLSSNSRQLRIQDVVLVKQRVTPASVDLDMEWWADKQVEMFEKHGIQPWQTSTWVHTHPAGVDRPSSTDESTMENSFGNWTFAIMLILTKEGHFYARMDFDHQFAWGEKIRFNIACDVRVDWSDPEAVTEEDLKRWDVEFKSLVSETFTLALRSLKDSDSAKERDSSAEPKPWFEGDDLFEGKEEDEYVELCRKHNLDPYDPASYEAIYGYWPGPGDLEFAGVSDADFWG